MRRDIFKAVIVWVIAGMVCAVFFTGCGSITAPTDTFYEGKNLSLNMLIFQAPLGTHFTAYYTDGHEIHVTTQESERWAVALIGCKRVEAVNTKSYSWTF